MTTSRNWLTMVAVVSWLVAALSGLAGAQRNAVSLPSGGGYSNTTLGFHYSPPSEMKDETESERTELRARAAARHTTNTLGLLLSMSSSPDAAAADWHLLSIETYPRKKFSDLDDISAKAKMSAWVAGISISSEKPRSVVLAGQSFAVYVFGEQDGLIKKGAVVWTTIRKDKLLSFAFVANSPQQLKRLAETMKSVKFF